MLRNHVPVTTLSKEGQESEDLLHNYVEHPRHNCSQLPSILSSDTPALPHRILSLLAAPVRVITLEYETDYQCLEF